MLLRFDHLVQWPWYIDSNLSTTHAEQVTNLGCVILKKVLSLSEKVSSI